MAFLELQFFSQTLHTNAQLQVILPQPGSQSGWDGKTPLPGPLSASWSGRRSQRLAAVTSVERYGEKKPLAMVRMSNLLGEYTNQRYGYPYFDYVSQEVWEISHSYFPLSEKREENFIAGLSMGGYGALKIGLRMPERFSYAAGLSAACDRYKPLPEEARSIQSIEEFRAKRRCLTVMSMKKPCILSQLRLPSGVFEFTEENLFSCGRRRQKRQSPSQVDDDLRYRG